MYPESKNPSSIKINILKGNKKNGFNTYDPLIKFKPYLTEHLDQTKWKTNNQITNAKQNKKSKEKETLLSRKVLKA